jgi:hypothetical protein
VSYQSIAIARDSDLETLPDGGAQIYWSNQATWGMSAGAAGVRMQVLILATTANTFASIIGQWSIDGRTWTDFELPIDGQDPDTMDPLSPTNGQVSHRQYAGPPWEMAPFVRYGIKTWRDDSALGRVRISCDIVVLPTLDPARLMVAAGDVVTVASNVIAGDGQIGVIDCTYGYDRGSYYIRCTNFNTAPTLADVLLVIETTFFMSDDVPGNVQLWREVATIPAISEFDATGARNVEVSDLDAYTRVRAKSATGTGTATFSIYAFLRPAD